MKLTLQQLEAHLWGAANILRGKTAGQDYKNYILSLMFYKRLCDQWEGGRRCQSRLLERTPPTCTTRFVLRTEPAFALLDIDLGAPIELLEGQMINPFASSVDVALDYATPRALGRFSLTRPPVPGRYERPGPKPKVCHLGPFLLRNVTVRVLNECKSPPLTHHGCV